MESYFALKHLHMTLAIVSGLYFAARGVWRLGLGRPLRSVVNRVLPHLIDTLLLASGVALAVMIGLSPHQAGWFGVKLLGVVFYIALGIAAFRARTSSTARVCFGAALLVWIWIIGTALNKSGLAWLA